MEKPQSQFWKTKAKSNTAGEISFDPIGWPLYVLLQAFPKVLNYKQFGRQQILVAVLHTALCFPRVEVSSLIWQSYVVTVTV